MTDTRLGGSSLPPVIKNLIIINALVWVAELTFGDTFVSTLSLHYYKSPEFGVWQLISYMFMHDPSNFLHILFNMFMLWMFGSTLENSWGAKRFLLFYLVCGIGAGLVQMMANSVELHMLMSQAEAGKIDMSEFQTRGGNIYAGIALGASGAVMGVMAAFAYLFPNTPLYIMFIPIPVKAKWVVIGYFLIDVFGGVNPRSGGNIAHFAHIGGALFGLILVMTMNKANRRDFY